MNRAMNEDEVSLRNELKELAYKKSQLGRNRSVHNAHDPKRLPPFSSSRMNDENEQRGGSRRPNGAFDDQLDRKRRRVQGPLPGRPQFKSSQNHSEHDDRERRASAIDNGRKRSSQIVEVTPTDQAGEDGEVSSRNDDEAPSSVSRRSSIQQGNPTAKARNRRMFGALMGHLGQAKRLIERDAELLRRQSSLTTQVVQKEEKEKKRLAEIEAKKKEHQDKAARAEKAAIIAQQEIARVKLDTLRWARYQRTTTKFLETLTLPAIYFLPFKHSEDTQAMLNTAQESLEQRIEARQRDDEVKFQELENEYEKRRAELEESKQEEVVDSTKVEEMEEESLHPEKIEGAATVVVGDDSTNTDVKVVDVPEASPISSPMEASENSTRIDECSTSSHPVVENVSDETEGIQAIDNPDAVPNEKQEDAEVVDSQEQNSKPCLIPSEMKVGDLRDELKSRGLDTKGIKSVLVKRLEAVL